MASAAQIQANRLNAQKSTGPRTAEGKAVVSQNAVKHGLSGQEVVIQGEDLGEFEFYRERMIEELDPVGPVESSLAERIVGLSWRLRRAERLQTVAFDSLYARQKHDLCETFDQKQDADGDSPFGRAIVGDFSNCRVLDRLLMYERRIEHSLCKMMAELKRHRLLKEVAPGGMWELRRALASDDDAGMENHGRDARAAKPPADGTASGPKRDASDVASLEISNSELHPSSLAPFPEPSCKTKPNSPMSNDGQVPDSEGVTIGSSTPEPGGTNPISAGPFSLRTSILTLQTPSEALADSSCSAPAQGYNLVVSNQNGFGVSSLR